MPLSTEIPTAPCSVGLCNIRTIIKIHSYQFWTKKLLHRLLSGCLLMWEVSFSLMSLGITSQHPGSNDTSFLTSSAVRRSPAWWESDTSFSQEIIGEIIRRRELAVFVWQKYPGPGVSAQGGPNPWIWSFAWSNMKFAVNIQTPN